MALWGGVTLTTARPPRIVGAMGDKRRDRRIPLSRFWLDWRISFFLVGVCLLILGAVVIALWRGPEATPPVFVPSATVHRERAEVYERLGKMAEAVQEYQAALRLAPEDPAIHKALAQLLEKQGRREEALIHYERSLQLDPASKDLSAIQERIERLRGARGWGRDDRE
jgi:tetratricopeptide (TPR) repeat protein